MSQAGMDAPRHSSSARTSSSTTTTGSRTSRRACTTSSRAGSVMCSGITCPARARSTVRRSTRPARPDSRCRPSFYSGRVKRLTAIPGPDGLAVHVERMAEIDVTSLATLTRSLGQIESRASPSRVRAIRFTSSRVSASSSLRAASSTACAVDASGARTRSLTVVSVISATRRRRGNDGVVTPRSQRETVIDSTPSSAASCFWVRPALRLAMRSRPPTPPLSWVPKHGVDNRRVGHPQPARLTPRQRPDSRTRFPHRSQR